MSQFSHLDQAGHAQMVDVSAKPANYRQAVASGKVSMSTTLIAAIRQQSLPKGDAFATARIAGIMAAKQTAQLIPLCHPLPLSQVLLDLTLQDDGVTITATVATCAATGVEMEALTAVSVAALTLYDMCKAVDKSMIISDIRLESKLGGKSGDWQRS